MPQPVKITIEITQREDGHCSIKSDPNFETMMMMSKSGHGLTTAHGYAMRMLLAALGRSKELQQDSRSPIWIPGSRRSH